MTVMFLDTCLFDIRDTPILEDQLRQFEGGRYSGGSDSNQKQRTKGVINRKKEAVNQFGGGLLHFGLEGPSSVQYCITSDNDIENPPAKRLKKSIDNMLEKIKANGKTDSTLVKIRQRKIISATTKNMQFLAV